MWGLRNADQGCSSLCVRWLPTMNCSTSCMEWETTLCYLRSKYGTLGTMESLRGIYWPGPLMSLLWCFFGLDEPKKDGPLICLCVSVPLIALFETYPLVASIVLSLERQRGWQKHLKYQYSASSPFSVLSLLLFSVTHPSDAWECHLFSRKAVTRIRW